VDIDAVEHTGQVGAIDLGAPHPKRLDARALDEVEDLLAVLLTDGVAEDSAEQPNVLAQRLGGGAADFRTPDRADRCELSIPDLRHVVSIGASSGSQRNLM